ncbi:zinc finger lsd1 subclass family protein (macronuclear) [Tetrahymena thermophila SB210]|uniref:Zinc finger lsd1 subclass family protein n=1 Tax=Tetrahymena thermophila (strain SB210) TaxID=312017 RepID=Q234Z0_TETTS|nr:zinc finger lsd1 subclass family protein [Tetrahymena thermophila SB210]EAR91863.2 zinc finger lsd1 subclass family protein [Tetrahymena thermophila SB210]|eukprot:XP_001012108.2 zinc finger lsd1 subclass family protein [Tetrahymena thermophila SB210]
MSYDQVSNQVTLKKLKSLDKELTLIYQTQANAIWRTSFTQGQTQILQVNGQNQITSMERIICQNGQFLTSNSDCTQCKIDEILQNDKCVSCPQGSKKLDINDNVCTSSVSSNCDQPSAQKSCDCPNYYYQNSSQKCIQCQTGQQFNNIKDSCDQACDDGSFFNGSACQKCTINCIKCQSDKTCDQCDQTNGYFLDANKQSCLKCDQNLYQILNNQKNGCDCQKGYFLDNTSQCLKCQEGCNDCDNTKCNQCIQGYYKDASTNQCQKCMVNCDQCTQKDQCDQYKTCQSGQYLDKQTNQCQKCMDNCDQCTQKDQCDQWKTCPSGQYRDKQTNQCQKCMDNCDQCTQKDQCNQWKTCPSGQYRDKQTNQCQKCMDNCDLCTQKDQCNQWKTCQSGQYRDKETNQCQSCHPKCKSCNGPKENNCRECFNQFFVNEEGKCSECEIGQYKEKSKCMNCHWSCKECNGPDENNCLSCQNSLELSSENTCLSEKQKENEEDEKKICDYSWFEFEDKEKLCQKSLQYAKLNNQFIDKLSLVNLILAFIVSIFVPLFSPFAWFYIQQQQLIGNFALLKSMNIMWINQLQLKVSFGHNVINNFSNFLQKNEDKIFSFSLFDEFAFETQDLYKYFIENTLVHASIFIVIIVIFGLLMILKSHSAFAEKLLGYIQWNLFIRFFMISSNFIILSALIEFKQGSFKNITSLVIFIIIGIFYLIFQIKSLRFLFSYHYYLRFFDKKTLICLKNGLLDTQRWPRLFWFIFEIRKIISCVLLYLLQDTIYAPWIVLGLSIIQIVYFVIYKPLIDKKANILIVIIELMFAFVTTFISLQNYFSIQSGFASQSRNIFIAKVISGGLLAIQAFCLVALIYICAYAFIKLIIQNKKDRLQNSFENSHLIIQQNLKFESFDQIITALAGSSQNISWQQKTKKK